MFFVIFFWPSAWFCWMFGLFGVFCPAQILTVGCQTMAQNIYSSLLVVPFYLCCRDAKLWSSSRKYCNISLLPKSTFVMLIYLAFLLSSALVPRHWRKHAERQSANCEFWVGYCACNSVTLMEAVLWMSCIWANLRAGFSENCTHCF